METIHNNLKSKIKSAFTGILLLFTICFGASDEIKDLAEALKGDPCLIYDYVKNHIEYVPYWYPAKGPTGTYLDGCGNDFDQAALMVALLRESGFTSTTARYVMGNMSIPNENIANWFGIPNTTAAINSIISLSRMPPRSSGAVKRVWVKVIYKGNTYYFDPAFKQYSAKSRINIGSAMKFNINDISNFGNTGNDGGAGYVKNINASSVTKTLKKYSKDLSNYLKSNYPNADISDILGTRTIVNEPLSPIINYTSLPYPVSSTVEYDTFPSSWAPSLKVDCGPISWQISIPDVEGKRLTLTYSTSKNVKLMLDGTVVASGTNTGNSILKITYNFPAYSFTKTKETPIASPGTYAIVWNTEGVTYSTERLMKHQKRIAQYIDQGKALTSEMVVGETLHSIGLKYLRSCLRTFQIGDKIFDLKVVPHYYFGVAGQNDNGYFVDFISLTGLYSRTNDTLTNEQKIVMPPMMMINSALEHEIIDQTAGSENSGVSTSKGFEITNANGKKIYYISSVSQLDYLKNNNLLKYGAEYLGSGSYPGSFKQHLNQNWHLIVPADSSIKIGSSRAVPVYAMYNPASGSSYYQIAGGLNGGYSMAPNAQIDAVQVQKDINYSTLNNSNPYTSFNQISNLKSVTASDPVDMAGGAFIDNHVDLATAGEFPMAFTRQYSSNKNLEKTMLGYGWDHNYNINLSVSSNSDAVMGSRRAIDAVPLIVAIYSSVKLIAYANDARNWTIRSMVANWAVDQLFNNSVTISFGNKTMEFVRLSDGSYSAPPGINAELTKNSDGTYTMAERSGTTYKFNSDNKIEEITDIDGNKTQFSYQADKKLLLVRDDYGHWFSFGYLASGMLSLVTDQSSRSVRYTYDTTGNLVSFKDAESNDWAYTYDARHRLLTKKDPLNIVTITNVYDGDKVSKQKSPLQNGTLAIDKFYFSGYRNILENDSGKQTVYTFDYKGRSIAIQDHSGNTTTQVYDGENHTVESTDQCGRKTGFVYDGNNNLVEISRDSTNKALFKYDEDFNLIEKTDEMGRKTSMFYDSKRHLIKQTVYPDSDWEINTSYTYYSNGLLKTATNSKGVTETYYYDGNGNKISSKYGSNPEINYEYNSYGMLTKVTDQLNAEVTYTIDKRGLTTEIEDALGKKTDVAYYQNGLPSQKTDRNNKTTNITYTPSGETDTVSYPDGHQAIYTYDNLNQLVSITDSTYTTTFQYDEIGRIISTTDMQMFTVKSQYYPDGQLKKLIYPGNFSVEYTYDNFGRLQNVQDSLSNTFASYSYDASNLISDIQFGNGNETVYQYDGAGRMIGLTHVDTAGAFAQYNALLDEMGYPVSITENFPCSSVADSSNVSYTYNTNGTRLTSAGGKSMTYDNEGQTTAKGSVNYTFNVRHQLVTVTGSGYSYQYTYDETGHRVKAVRNGVTTKYIYGNGSRILAEADSAGVITRYYIYGHGLIGFYVPGTGYFTCHYDISGNMIAVSDDTGAVAAKFLYTPFGEMIDRTINNPDCDIPVGFAGAFGVLREPNGLYYMNARYYDPTIGRFLSEDPLGLGGDLTLYSYAGNNPVVFVDPSGLCRESGGSHNSWKNNVSNGLYFISDVANDISNYTGVTGTGSLIISGGLSTPYSTIPLAASFVSWGVSTGTGAAADWLVNDIPNLRNRLITAAPQLLMNLTATGTIGEEIFQGITGKVYDSYVKNPMRRAR